MKKIIKVISIILLISITISCVLVNALVEMEKWLDIIVNVISVLSASGLSFSLSFSFNNKSNNKIKQSQTSGDRSVQIQIGGDYNGK